MSVRPFPLVRAGRILLSVTILTLSGCVDLFFPRDDGGPRPTLNLVTLGLNSESTYYETLPNEQLEAAEYVPVDDEPRVIRGLIANEEDVDVYNIGPVAAGDRIVADVTADPSLDAAIALFDESGSVLLVNDHRNIYLGSAAPFIDVVIQQPSQACYLAYSATPGYPAENGEYGLLVSRTFPVDPPPLRPDVILLVFDGGRSVRVGGRSPVNVPVFDATNVSDEFSGQTETMMAKITAAVREDFEGFDVTILSTAEEAAAEPGISRIYFGTYDEALLGVAEGVDEFNSRQGQVAIVFTDTFNAFSRLRPSAEQMSQAIANVASHEIGHLLGMVHTHDPGGLMDVTASLKRLLQNQAFSHSPLYQAVFPVGFQDALQYLLNTVGGDVTVVMNKLLDRQSRVMAVKENDNEPPARESLRLSGCSLKPH